jgi:hypothetical protein
MFDGHFPMKRLLQGKTHLVFEAHSNSCQLQRGKVGDGQLRACKRENLSKLR